MNEPKERIIKAVRTGLNFFALFAICLEGGLSLAAVRMDAGPDRTLLLWATVLLLGLLVVIVAVLLFVRPWVLTGAPPPRPTVQQLSPPPYANPTIPIRYFLRGIRESYLHALADSGRTLPEHVRLNVMLILPIVPKNFQDHALKIVHVDYSNLFSNDEFEDQYPIGSAKCGEAWQLRQQRFWAVDLPDTNRVSIKRKTSRTALLRRSVVSSPFFCQGECIGGGCPVIRRK